MSEQVLVEIRDSLREIKALASSVMVMNSDSFTPAQEQDLEESLSQVRGGLFVASQPAEVLALKQKLMNGLDADREVFDIVHAINVLAMANADVIHIFTRYSAHVNCLFVNVEPMDSDYSSVKRKYIYAADVDIDKEEALEQLLSIESKLTELIIEAREEAETNVEVEA
ncbi:hypothetical protein L1D16_14985 [Vibrio sp. Isolate31]|uniref:hypothetical protein n=1 Tax=unclassified Vibrio TaxID=2614977 RepID=UPI001EFE3D31|nr:MULTISPECIES: hypothetical protein [unclassified Vibrio]MCG9554560.1 hypothetical protein [Vibrio sp. Isolate32]MCG9602132.1 hypothetical protein [Vibrio sp. Isolate31]